tara:strand:+ start:673 stop:885 length:213 start_codon:yes stop_codon:yes gene_type:complete
MPNKKFKKYPHGGALEGNSHADGGIPIEAEGGEFIVRKESVNPSTLAILEYINEYGDIPLMDARDRKETF